MGGAAALVNIEARGGRACALPLQLLGVVGSRGAAAVAAAWRRAPRPSATVDSPSGARRLAGSMPGRAAHQEAAAAGGAAAEPTAAGGSAGAVAQQPEQQGLAGAFPLVLKKLMENPPRDARLGERAGAAGARGTSTFPPPPPFPALHSPPSTAPPSPRRRRPPALGAGPVRVWGGWRSGGHPLRPLSPPRAPQRGGWGGGWERFRCVEAERSASGGRGAGAGRAAGGGCLRCRKVGLRGAFRCLCLLPARCRGQSCEPNPEGCARYLHRPARPGPFCS